MRQQSSLKDIILLFPVFLVEISEAGFKDLCCKVIQSHKAHPWWKTLAVTRHELRGFNLHYMYLLQFMIYLLLLCRASVCFSYVW